MKTAIICFFDAYPAKSGSGVVCCDFFKSWINKKKKLFQMSVSTQKNRNIENIKLLKNDPIFKILSIPILIYKILNYFKKSKKNLLIIEGPSWIFYTYIVFNYFRLFKKNTFLVYRSHSVEYEIRVKNSNKLISYITWYCERQVYRMSNISTTVSSLEKKKIFKYYNIETEIFPNSIRSSDISKVKQKKIKNLPKKFILYCGSYEYNPNKVAIDNIINKILPTISKKNIYLVLTGKNNIDFNNDYVCNYGHIERGKLKYLFKKTICLVVPLFEGYGTRIKILEAIVLNTRVISSFKGIEGIEYENKSRNFLITNNFNMIIRGILKFSKSKTKLKNNNKRISNIYSMEKNTLFFYKKVKKIFDATK